VRKCSVLLDTDCSCFQANSLRSSDTFLFSSIEDHRWQQLGGNQDYDSKWFMAYRPGSVGRGTGTTDTKCVTACIAQSALTTAGSCGRGSKGGKAAGAWRRSLALCTEDVKNEWSDTSTFSHVFTTWLVLHAGIKRLFQPNAHLYFKYVFLSHLCYMFRYVIHTHNTQ